ncbi:MAG: hydroxymethylbilane synthase, partial [Limnoraphis sp.]
FLRELEGGCQVPIGVNSEVENNQLTLIGMVASLDGKRLIRDTVSGETTNAEQLGIDLAHRLREQGAKEILDQIFAEIQRQ